MNDHLHHLHFEVNHYGVLPGTAVIGLDGESPCPGDRWCLEPYSHELPASAPPYFRLSSDAVSTVHRKYSMSGQFDNEKFYITKE